MMNLIKWEMKNLLKSKAFLGIGIATMLLGSFMLVMDIGKEGWTGYYEFLSSCNNFGSMFMLFFGGIFAGLHVAGAFEERKMQAAVMAGNSRAKTLFAKMFSLAAAITLIYVVMVGALSTVGFILFGTEIEDGSFLRCVLVRSLVYLIVEISALFLCVPFSLKIRKPGIAVIINMLVMVFVNIGVEMIAGKEWGEPLVAFTPFGQAGLLLGDVTNSNLAIALSVAVAFITVISMISYYLFRKVELK